MRYNTVMVETKNISPEEEIKNLEQQLEAKKRELAVAGVPAKEEKEVFREVLKEHIETLRPSTPPTDTTIPPTPSASVVIPAPQNSQGRIKEDEANEATVRMLVEKAMAGTIEDAVKEAQKISPYMLDELHDHLVDDMYDKLVVLRKIKAL